MSAMERFLVFKKIAISLIKNLFSYFESNETFTWIAIYIKTKPYAFKLKA